MCFQAITSQPQSYALQLLDQFAGFVKTRKDDAAQLCSTVAIQAPEQNCVIVGGEAHATCMVVNCYHYSTETDSSCLSTCSELILLLLPGLSHML